MIPALDGSVDVTIQTRRIPIQRLGMRMMNVQCILMILMSLRIPPMSVSGIRLSCMPAILHPRASLQRTL